MKSLIFLALVLAVSPIRGQAGDAADIRPAEGVLTLDFALGGNFRLEEGSGGTLSMRRWMSETTALSVGVTLTAGDNERDWNGWTYEPDSLIVEQERLEGDNHQVAVEVLYQKIVRGSGPWLVLGAGPLAGYRTSNGTSENLFIDGRKSTNEGRTTTFGVQGLIAGEWMLARGLSLSASYMPILAWENNETEYWEFNEGELSRRSERSSSGWDLEPGRVRLGLSIWFD